MKALTTLDTSKNDNADRTNAKIASNGTNRTYRDALLGVAEYLQSKYGKGAQIANLTPQQAYEYLNARKSEVSQKTLNRDRQAMQHVLIFNRSLQNGETLKVVKSELKTELTSRAYSTREVNQLVKNADSRLAVAIEVAREAGLRAHELITIRKLDPNNQNAIPSNRLGRKEQADTFAKSPERWTGRENWERYVVTGKGGLVREVRLSPETAEKLESCRCEERTIRDRTINYSSRYDLPSGQTFSRQFTQLSKSELGYSSGAHGLRHSYAQERLADYLRAGLSRDEALGMVSVEMGHFRGEITEVYIR